jgi:hypothetical protein
VLHLRLFAACRKVGGAEFKAWAERNELVVGGIDWHA